MIANITVTDQYTTLLSAGQDVRLANVGMYFCNRSNTANVVSIYAMQSGASPSDKNIIAYNVPLPPGETYYFGQEKFILDSGERIVAKAGAGSIIATLTFMGIGSSPYSTEASGASVIANGEVTGVVVTGGGSGYTSAPNVSFTGCGGSGATAVATINSSGQVTGVTITDGGSGYVCGPDVELEGGNEPEWSPWAVTKDGNLKAWWKFDETSGNVGVDAKGGLIATLRNMSDADWVAGKKNNALNFDNTTSLALDYANGSFLSVTTDRYFSDTKLLIQSNTTDGSVDFVDSSDSKHEITKAGDVHHDDSYVKFGSSSMRFDGVGDYLSIDSHSDFNFGTGDFTVEFWFYLTSASDTPLFEARGGGLDASNFTITAYDNDTIRIFSSAALISSSGTSYLNTWTHVAVVRESSTTKLYINGVSVGSTTSLGDVVNTQPVLIGAGRYSSSVAPNKFFNGSMEDVRITKGVARYTANFDTTDAQAFLGMSSANSEAVEFNQDPFSISIWFKSGHTPITGNNNRSLISSKHYYNAGGPDGNFVIGTGGHDQGKLLRVYFYKGADGSTEAGANFSFKDSDNNVIDPHDGSWHNCILVSDGTSCNAYLDGNLSANSFSYTYPIKDAFQNGFFIGLTPWADWAKWKGQLDDIRIYDIKLSSEDAKNISGGDWA